MSKATGIPSPKFSLGTSTRRHHPCQCSGPGGVVFTSCPIASMTRRHTAAVVIASLREFVDPSGAFRHGVVAVMLEHQVGDAPDVDLGYHAANGRRGFA
jgi:hypothetical protein